MVSVNRLGMTLEEAPKLALPFAVLAEKTRAETLDFFL